MEFWTELWKLIGITWPHAASVVIAATVLYLVFTMVLRVWGQRLFANRSGTGLAVVLVLGSVVGRSMLGPGPTLLGGLLCVATLIALEWFFGAGRRSGLIGHRRAVVIYANGSVDHQTMRRYHLSERIVWATLRKAGVTHKDEVAAVVLETDGTLSVVRAGKQVDPQLLKDVRGAEALLGPE